MARVPFILCEDFFTCSVGDCFTISNHESRHLVTVLRAREGYNFIAFNGRGKGCRAEIVETSGKSLVARIIERFEDENQTEPQLTIAVGVVKGSRMDWAIEKAAETGVTNFIPIITEFSVVKPKRNKLERWRGIALAAAKQSRRMWLMDVEEPISIDKLLNYTESTLTIILDTSANCIPLIRCLEDSNPLQNLRVIIGPEGGFSDPEIDKFKGLNIPLVSIGSNPLRTETAVAVSVGIIRAIYSGELS
ncbi:MAG: 16S rRNA (uracil(1498)-N(3))-methyltransferase [Calditrichaeota bacterium]|nr:16S rRNA (uracil(1498)-N(3))-methyltransferase [Calditrichota bacterium]